MSTKPESPAIHIAPEHQSAPKESWADGEVRKAAEEIRTGQFVPQADDADDCLPVLLQRGAGIVNPSKLAMKDVVNTSELAQHPRVIEALERLQREHREAKTSQEMVEKSQMLFEMNERAAQRNQWDGQGRWMGQENEEMRIGLILTPQEFMRRLHLVVSESRVWINDFAAYKRVAVMAPDATPAPLILLPGQPLPRRDGKMQVATLQYPCGSEWMVMKFDEYGVPVKAKYLGWRTALLSMIRLGVITEKEAHKAFPLGSGPAAAWYKEQLFEYRSERGTVQ
jgi:hypothetical protein